MDTILLIAYNDEVSGSNPDLPTYYLTLKDSDIMSEQKLSVLLGLRDRVEKTFSNGIEDNFNKFKNKASLFRGERRTYVAEAGCADEPTKRGFTNVASTVKEQLDWFVKHSQDFFEVVLSIEATNASGTPKAELVVDGVNWGTYSTLELLRLKSILDGKLKGLLTEIPVRKEDVIWTKSTESLFEDRDIYESPKEEGYAKTTLKETYIVHDPHIKDSPGRAPIIADKNTQVNIGQYTAQQFSGEMTLLQRAKMYVRYETLYKGIISALETANNVVAIKSQLGNKVLDYIFEDKKPGETNQ